MQKEAPENVENRGPLRPTLQNLHWKQYYKSCIFQKKSQIVEFKRSLFWYQTFKIEEIETYASQDDLKFT